MEVLFLAHGEFDHFGRDIVISEYDGCPRLSLAPDHCKCDRAKSRGDASGRDLPQFSPLAADQVTSLYGAGEFQSSEQTVRAPFVMQSRHWLLSEVATLLEIDGSLDYSYLGRHYRLVEFETEPGSARFD